MLLGWVAASLTYETTQIDHEAQIGTAGWCWRSSRSCRTQRSESNCSGKTNRQRQYTGHRQNERIGGSDQLKNSVGLGKVALDGPCCKSLGRNLVDPGELRPRRTMRWICRSNLRKNQPRWNCTMQQSCALVDPNDTARCCPRSETRILPEQRIDLETNCSDTTCYKIAQIK
jgi:hypothetical protein